MTEPIKNSLAFPALQTSRKSGDENFSLRGEPLDLQLSAFWQWSSSDLVSNTMRGVLAEFLVASALGLADGARNQWDAFDLLLADGTRLEVKSAAYLQSWAHAKLSNIVFTIRPTLLPGVLKQTGFHQSCVVRQTFIFFVYSTTERKLRLTRCGLSNGGFTRCVLRFWTSDTHRRKQSAWRVCSSCNRLRRRLKI